MNVNRVVRTASCTAFATAMATSALADVSGGPYSYGRGMMWGGDQWGGFGMVLGPIFMILVLVGIVAGVFYVARIYFEHGMAAGNTAADGRAMSVLRERFAKGEIDAKEYEERRRLLSE